MRMHESPCCCCTPKRQTDSRKADRRFASIRVETEDVQPVGRPRETVGVGLGVRVLATLSSGEPIPGPRPHSEIPTALRHRRRTHSRERRGSANRRKARQKFSCLQARNTNSRKNTLHEATTRLAKGWQRIGIEHLTVRGMARSRRLWRSIMAGALQEFRRQPEYTARLCGTAAIVADRWRASTRVGTPSGFAVGRVLEIAEFRRDGFQ